MATANEAPGLAPGRDEESEHRRVELKEHIKLRPETYIGPVDSEAQRTLVVEGGRLVERELAEVVPGLLKIFDEPLVNAGDNKQRDPSMTQLAVTFQDDGGICIRNNGKGLPVVEHPTEKMYVPVLVFGHLLTGSNFNDKKKKTVGGRNGYGAKLTNIYSTRFKVRTADRQRQLSVEWTNNMDAVGKPKVTRCKSEFTEVTFYPDYPRFGLAGLTPGMRQLMERRVYDMAASTPASLTVKLNGEKLPSTFGGYCAMIAGGTGRLFDKSDRWEVCVMVPPDGMTTRQMGFVNGIWTRLGGTHITHVQDQLCKVLGDCLKKTHKLELRKGLIKDSLLWVVNALIENPAFESQCKNSLTSKAAQFGSAYKPSKRFLREAVKDSEGSLMERLVAVATSKQDAALSKQDGRKKARVAVDKLHDAGDAGTARSSGCTLVFTEGDSAAALAVAGRPNSKQFGVMPLRGKLINARAASRKMLADNKEVQDITKALGLSHGKKYDTPAAMASLRYGSVMFMADQDYDGFHIVGLLINLFEHLWPELLERPGFFCRMRTPIVKARRGREAREFFRMADYEAWSKSRGGERWEVKYIKGLGTNTSKEGKKFFARLDHYRIALDHDEDAHRSLEKAFHKDKADERKAWLSGVSTEVLEHQDASHTRQTCTDFVDDEMVQFSLYNVHRSIPRADDGLKVAQRKILHTFFAKNFVRDVKVAQAGAIVSQLTHYHHGENNMFNSIINMAQEYPGSNNLPVLVPEGQFGTRLAGGADAASPRYIFTRLQPWTRLVFPAADDPVLAPLLEEGQPIEPKHLAPIVPMVLINGQSSIASGWSTSVPSHHPLEVLRNTRRLVRGEALRPMRPWFRGWRGRIAVDDDGQNFTSSGIARWDGGRKVEITELPVGVWTNSYKQHLEKLVAKNLVQHFTEDHTDIRVRFEVTLRTRPPAPPPAAGGSSDMVSVVSAIGRGVRTHDLPPALHKAFNLSRRHNMHNMHLFSGDDRCTKFAGFEAIMAVHHRMRLACYERRKAYQLEQLRARMETLEERARFVEMVVADRIVIKGVPKPALLDELANRHRFADPARLLALPLAQITQTEVEKLRREVGEARRQHADLLATSHQQLWLRDLDALEAELQRSWGETLEGGGRDSDSDDLGDDTGSVDDTPSGQPRQTAKRKGSPAGSAPTLDAFFPPPGKRSKS